MKQDKRIEYIAPIVITVLILLYLVVCFGVLMAILPGIWKYILLIVPVAIAGVSIFVCVERIKEIRSGEEDDLSQY